MTEASDWTTTTTPTQQQGTERREDPQAAHSSDLFDGELFGDELIDIYNAAVSEGTAAEGHPRNEEIPALPPQQNAAVATTASDDEKAGDSVHPGARVAETAARLDGGFDLTTLLTPSPPSENNECKTQTNSMELDATTATAPVTAPTTPVGVAGTAATKRKASTPLEPCKIKKTASTVSMVANSTPAVPSVPGTTNMVVSADSKTEAIHSSQAVTAHPRASTIQIAAHPPPVPIGPGASFHKKAVTHQKPRPNTIVPEAAVSAPKSPAPKATEADFKTVAQAAVSSLIMSTKNGEVVPLEVGDQDINTSTAHIKALTGSNWVAACSGAGAAAVAGGGSPPAGASGDAKANNRSRRQNLTADERARQNRDRNREHARNTRLRKKAYVEELKRTLTELVAQRDKLAVEKRQAAQREVEQREVRFRVIEEFLNLRGRNETNHTSWAAILDSNFALTMPSTDFRAMINGGAVAEASEGGGVQLEKVHSGVHETMNESNSFALFLQSLGGDSESSHDAPLRFVYNCDRNNFFMDDNHAVLDWSAGTVGVTKRGAPKEVTMRGSVRASFCPASNKLLSASVMFDSGAVLSQLKEFLKIPTSTSYATDAQAAHRADAILDSLQMPQLNNTTDVLPTIVPQGESSDEGP